MQTVLALTEFYISPFFVAIGLAFMLDGLINYFIIGNIGLEEDRREQGRQSLLWAASFFILALCLILLSRWTDALIGRIQDRAEIEVDRQDETLNIPNVPNLR
jgi:hypothetical protein